MAIIENSAVIPGVPADFHVLEIEHIELTEGTKFGTPGVPGESFIAWMSPKLGDKATLGGNVRAALGAVPTDPAFNTDVLIGRRFRHMTTHNDRLIGAASGRMACSAPNLQNIPREPAYRRCIRPSAGRVLIKADYSQIELRIAARISGDSAMQAAFRAGEDLHTKTARAVLDREPTAEDRQLAKALNFGLLYGMGAERLRAYARDEYGVTLSEDETAQFQQRFFQAYPGLRARHRGQREDEVTTSTLAGRPRHRVSQFTEKLNSPVQGIGADILKGALARLWADRASAPSAAPVLVVHDEIVCEVDHRDADACAAWLTAHMTAAGAAVLMEVPVVIETQIVADWSGTRWEMTRDEVGKDEDR